MLWNERPAQRPLFSLDLIQWWKFHITDNGLIHQTPLSPPGSLFVACSGRTGCPLDTVAGACSQVCECNRRGHYSTVGVKLRGRCWLAQSVCTVYTSDCVLEGGNCTHICLWLRMKRCVHMCQHCYVILSAHHLLNDCFFIATLIYIQKEYTWEYVCVTKDCNVTHLLPVPASW